MPLLFQFPESKGNHNSIKSSIRPRSTSQLFRRVVALVVTQKLLGYTRGLSVKLQGRYCDIAFAHSEIELVKPTLNGARFEIDSFHDHVYEETLQIYSAVDVEELAPHLAGTQHHHPNTPAENIKEYYKRTLTTPFSDHLVSELDTRFDADSSNIVIQFMHLLSSELES